MKKYSRACLDENLDNGYYSHWVQCEQGNAFAPTGRHVIIKVSDDLNIHFEDLIVALLLSYI